jgi:hypothetical protein
MHTMVKEKIINEKPDSRHCEGVHTTSPGFQPSPEAISYTRMKFRGDCFGATLLFKSSFYAAPRNDDKSAGSLAAVNINSKGFSVSIYRGRRQPACHRRECLTADNKR